MRGEFYGTMILLVEIVEFYCVGILETWCSRREDCTNSPGGGVMYGPQKEVYENGKWLSRDLCPLYVSVYSRLVAAVGYDNLFYLGPVTFPLVVCCALLHTLLHAYVSLNSMRKKTKIEVGSS